MKFEVSILNKLDQLIKCGHGAQVREQLGRLKLAEVPRSYCSAMAKIALRIGYASYAHLLLQPLVNDEKKFGKAMSPDEWMQYGMCLKQMGASDHALKVFQKLNPEQVPEVLLYQAITLFTQWRYSEAIVPLQAYIQNPTTSTYQKEIGTLNLASALIFEGCLGEARKLIGPLVEHARRGKLHLLRGNGLELMAQMAIYEGKYSEAQIHLLEASQLIQYSAPVYQLFLEKWSAVVQLRLTNCSLLSLQNMNWVRDKAIALQHWESVRDCDFFFATSKNDRHLFHRVYFGTPYNEYRRRLVRNFHDPQPIPSYFDWRGNTAHQPAVGPMGVLDLSEKNGDQNLRVVKALSMDFYAPLKPFELYLNLYPHEFLDPEEALPRIYSAVSRLKKWLKKMKYPLEVEHSTAGYRLNWTGPFTIRIPQALTFRRTSDEWFERLQIHFHGQAFTSTQAAEALGLSQRAFLRLLKESAHADLLSVTGRGRSTRYHFKSATSAAA
ncbi:MAG: hypothetical protein AB7N80_11165 [Bdellovibrionales bacterium]